MLMRFSYSITGRSKNEVLTGNFWHKTGYTNGFTGFSLKTSDRYKPRKFRSLAPLLANGVRLSKTRNDQESSS